MSVASKVISFEPVPSRLEGITENRERMASRVIPFNISYLDDCCLGIHPTDLIVMSSATGAGKTTAGMLMASQAALAGLRAHYFALEAYETEIEMRLLFQELSQLMKEEGMWRPDITLNRWIYGKLPELGRFETEGKRRVGESLRSLHTLYRPSQFTHQDITRQLMAVKGETDLVVLDHLHYVDADGPNENLEMKKIVKAIRDASLVLEVPMVVIAHLRKKQGPRGHRALPELDDIHGSSDIAKVATKIVMLAPCPAISAGDSERNRHLASTAIQVLKDRYAGATNYVGLISYDLSSMRYVNEYGVARLAPRGNELLHLFPDELPVWAKERGNGLRMQLGDETKLS